MTRYDMSRSSHFRRVLRIVGKVAEDGLQAGYFDMPGGASRICRTEDLKRAQAFWGPLLAEPITPENPLHLDLESGRAWRGRGGDDRPAQTIPPAPEGDGR